MREVAERTRSIIERRRAEQDLQDLTTSLERQVEERTNELRANVNRLRTTFETSYIYQGYITRDGTLLDANNASLAGIQCRLEDVVGRPFWDTPWFAGTPGMPEAVQQAVQLAAEGQTVQRSILLKLPTGERAFDFALRPVKNERGDVIAIIPEAVETTGRIKAEDALRQAQKMEAIGQLTGGIAHDFNNMMAVVIGAMNLLQRRLAQGGTDVSRYVDAAIDGATRAASLTQRLLAFSRQQALAPEAIDAQPHGCSHDRDAQPHARRADQGRDGAGVAAFGEPTPIRSNLKTSILNLSVNARDAMPDGGKLTIETANTHIDEEYADEYRNCRRPVRPP